MIEKRYTSRRARRPLDRQLMRPWLVSLLNDQCVNGLSWINKKQMVFEVKWRHAARQGWSISKDADIFERWAKHTGKFHDGEKPDPKRWKANFRCALNSLPDIVEDKKESNTKGNNAYRVYRMLNGVEKKQKKTRKYTRVKYEYQERLELKSDGEDSFTSDDHIPSSPEADLERRIPNFSQIEDTCTKNYRINSPTGCSGGKVIINGGSYDIKTEPFDWTTNLDQKSSFCSSALDSGNFYCRQFPQIKSEPDLEEVIQVITYEETHQMSPTDNSDTPKEDWNDICLIDLVTEPAVVTITNEETAFSEPTALISLNSNM